MDRIERCIIAVTVIGTRRPVRLFLALLRVW
jgi:hypothetical protein